MLDNLTFNTLINHIVFTMDNFLKDKDYSKELQEYLYLICTGMILSYGDEYIEDIYNLLSSVKFKDINRKINNNIFSYVNPTKHNYLNKLFNVKSNFPTICFDYELLYENIDSSSIKTIEYLVHELNYIFFNKKKRYSLIDSIKIRYDYYKNSIDIENDEDSTFNRVVNVLQSEDIIKRILELRNCNIKNKKFKKALDKLSNIDGDTYKFEGLDVLANLLRPLYKFKDTKTFIDKSMYDHSDLIEEEFDKVLGKNSYKRVCKSLDLINGMISKDKGHYSYYALSLEYVAIRNDFVNRYINIRYLKKA